MTTKIKLTDTRLQTAEAVLMTLIEEDNLGSHDFRALAQAHNIVHTFRQHGKTRKP